MRWEYRLVRLTSDASSDLFVMALDEDGRLVEREDDPDPGEYLNDLGSEGWELVQITQRQFLVGHLLLLWFKRKAS